MTNNFGQIDVTVVGGGLAGMAAAFHLANAGLRVLCVEPEAETKDPVGESLDWSAPELLASLGLPIERLLHEDIATYKRHVILKLRSGAAQHYVPSDWLARPPFNVELRTIHVDRTRLDSELRGIALAAGVALLRDSVVQVERKEERFTGPIFWKIAMRRALGSSKQGDTIVGDFYKPFSGLAGPWEFMRFCDGASLPRFWRKSHYSCRPCTCRLSFSMARTMRRFPRHSPVALLN